MTRSDHANRPRRVPKMDREGSLRRQTRDLLHTGQWDHLPTTFRHPRRPMDD